MSDPQLDTVLTCNTCSLPPSAFPTHPDETTSFRQYQNLRIFCRQRVHPSKVKNLLVLHGFTDHSGGTITKIFDFFYEQGFNLFAIDWPSHGQSEIIEDRKVFIPDFVQSVNIVLDHLAYINELNALETLVVGHSMGGLITSMLASTECAHLCKGVILAAPAFRINHWILDYFSWTVRCVLYFNNKFQILANLVNTTVYANPEDAEMYINDTLISANVVNGRTVMNMVDHGLDQMFNKQENVPMLILAGTKDTLVAYSGSVDKAAHFKNAKSELKTYPACHMIFHETFTEEMLNDVMRWIDALDK